MGSTFLLDSLTIARLLRGGIQHLPASISGREVLSGHPTLIPHMKIPEGEARGVSVKEGKRELVVLVFFPEQGRGRWVHGPLNRKTDLMHPKPSNSMGE